MIINVLSKERQIELEQKISNCLQILYELENITQYEEKEIGDCINLLQDTIINNESKYEVE